MKSSGLLKWLMIPVALLVLWVMIRVFSGGDGGTATGDRRPAPDARGNAGAGHRG